MAAGHAVHLRHKHQHRIDMEQGLRQPLLPDDRSSSDGGDVAVLAGDGSAAAVQFAQSVVNQQRWQAVYCMLPDVSAHDVSSQAVSISSDAASPEDALAGRADVTHVFYVAEAAGGSGKQLAAAQDAFRRLVDAAQEAGARLQQAHLSLVQPAGGAVGPAGKTLPVCGDGGGPHLAIAAKRGLGSAPDLLHGAPRQRPAARSPGALAEAWARGRWLLGLLVLQSASSAILDMYQDLLKQHLVVTLFLTMLVGAGGNAGNQSAIKVIRGLATGKYRCSARSARRVLLGQAIIALVLGGVLSAGGLARVYITHGVLWDAAAIAASLFLIVLSSILLGTALPFGLAAAGVDPAHAGSSIQVVMDVLGVGITCVVCTLVLDQGIRPALRHGTGGSQQPLGEHSALANHT